MNRWTIYEVIYGTWNVAGRRGGGGFEEARRHESDARGFQRMEGKPILWGYTMGLLGLN